MKSLYFDCLYGVSMDAVTAALIAAGAREDYLYKELKKIDIKNYRVSIEKQIREGMDVTIFSIQSTLEHLEKQEMESSDLLEYILSNGAVGDPTARMKKNIIQTLDLIDRSGLSYFVKDKSAKIFSCVAAAEKEVYSSHPENVLFNEISGASSILSVVAALICLENIGPDKIYSSAINEGYGSTYNEYGRTPIPTPVMFEIFSSEGVRVRQIDQQGEMVSKEGAAFITEVTENLGFMPELRIDKIGYGAEKKPANIYNVTRVVVGEE